MGPSTLSSWVMLIARTLSARGIDADAVLRRAKLSSDLLQDPNARYPLGAVQRLWLAAADEVGDPCFGLEVGSAWHPTTFHALGYSALASATLRQALGYVARYSRIVSTGARVELAEQDGEVSVLLASRLAEHHLPAVAERIVAQAGLAAIAVLCCEVRRAPPGLLRVEFADTDSTCGPRLSAFFGCPARFGAARNALVFERESVDAPLPTANPLLLHSNERLLAHYLARLDASQTSERLRSWLIRSLPSGQAGQAAAAASLNLSLRTMQRKLKEEGLTFRQVLDDTRRHLAEVYSKDATLSSAEIAYLLGFAEATSYARAKRRWSRTAPDPAG